MPDGGAASHGRPLCSCHGEPMDKAGGRRGKGGPWSCAVKRRDRQRKRYRADTAGANYARAKARLRARIRRKRRHIEELEASLHGEAQDTR